MLRPSTFDSETLKLLLLRTRSKINLLTPSNISFLSFKVMSTQVKLFNPVGARRPAPCCPFTALLPEDGPQSAPGRWGG